MYTNMVERKCGRGNKKVLV